MISLLSIKSKRFTISVLYRKHATYDGTHFMPSAWRKGYWNNGIMIKNAYLQFLDQAIRIWIYNFSVQESPNTPTHQDSITPVLFIGDAI